MIGYAHCPRCGNVRLQKVSRDRVTYGLKLFVTRVLHVPAYRCEPCRLKFFTMRPTIKSLPPRDAAENDSAAEKASQTAS
jgi:hypothetical protein